jgi:stalled ribosome alternative rescue factor ArfA
MAYLKKPVKRNPVATLLQRNTSFRTKQFKDKKKYTRKDKHKEGEPT